MPSASSGCDVGHAGHRPHDDLAEDDDDEQPHPFDQRRRRRDARIARLGPGWLPPVHADHPPRHLGDERHRPQPVPQRPVERDADHEQDGRDEVARRVRERPGTVMRVVQPRAEPQDHQDEGVRRVGEREPGRAVPRDVPDEHGHHRDGEHLPEREDADAHVVGRVEVVVQGAVQPRGPDRIEEEDEPADPRPRRVRGQATGELGDDHDEDQVEEELEEGHAPVGRPILVPAGRLPQPPERGRLRHGLESSPLRRPRGVRRNPFRTPRGRKPVLAVAGASGGVEHSFAAPSGLLASRVSGAARRNGCSVEPGTSSSSTTTRSTDASSRRRSPERGSEPPRRTTAPRPWRRSARTLPT